MFEFIKKALSGSNEAEIKRLRKTVEQIGALEGQMQKLLRRGDARLYRQIARARQGAARIWTSCCPKPTRWCARAAVRALGQRPFDTQMIGAIVLHQGRIAEMRTGEGKTLTAALPAFLNALPGEGRNTSSPSTNIWRASIRVDGQGLPLPRADGGPDRA